MIEIISINHLRDGGTIVIKFTKDDYMFKVIRDFSIGTTENKYYKVESFDVKTELIEDSELLIDLKEALKYQRSDIDKFLKVHEPIENKNPNCPDGKCGMRKKKKPLTPKVRFRRKLRRVCRKST